MDKATKKGKDLHHSDFTEFSHSTEEEEKREGCLALTSVIAQIS